MLTDDALMFRSQACIGSGSRGCAEARRGALGDRRGTQTNRNSVQPCSGADRDSPGAACRDRFRTQTARKEPIPQVPFLSPV